MLIELLAVAGSVVGFVAVTLSIASGLYYLSELVEENTELTKRLLGRLIKSTAAYLTLLWFFDDFPLKLTIFSLFSYFIYYQNLKKFPNIDLTGSIFLATCILALLNHFLWFKHFNNPYVPTIDERLNPDFKLPHYPSFTEIASFFGLCIWLIPFGFFISLSANENTLPMSLSEVEPLQSQNNGENVKRSITLIKYLLQILTGKAKQLLNAFSLRTSGGNSSSRNPNELYI
ncbi:hypothetical protein KL918_005134 [Ogataea parapolymorpha]|uniref:Integral membrane protein of the early Golgi apparatus and endoplasmic reticulum n=1 Tax=Ogataea parapolymorpha (strain ATCC 26012 / BCRC 20466 / JCM 22074 / NRRL Y-7560 / DL-1) TaxID=871575 RepID=W1QBI7_OGAPD|nr:Integral membrane protein of the early Golgi apparatus and endoplasmic reticulum [Ogataea parapolymorpha DL-1]ESW98411.1 Integral membrane protein of the early Golgi apparatus and endoplasmic reticulum [Ogataea parapolymorpha DL-1]KAG7864813.1 hypothetical protein KL918_005134 [Ogataea parapolymorpha]KAG7873317.1 hypothetical protein KL916_002266 [Ogataea parapolymorpha]KAG7886359.1 hypothetical protein KL938_000012 [Ogataea parapolymorpha]